MLSEQAKPFQQTLKFPAARIAELRQAIDPDVIVGALQEEWSYPCNRELAVIDCQAIRVFPRRDEFVIEYEITFRRDDGTDYTEVFFGELVGNAAHDCCQHVIERLRKSKRRQIPADGTTDLISALPRLGMVLRAQTLDEKLHGLILMHDHDAAQQILSSYLPFQSDGKDIYTMEILSHRLGRRCVARFQTKAQNGASAATQPLSVIAKIFKKFDRRGEKVYVDMMELWQRGFNYGADDGIRICEPLGYDQDWQILFMEDAPGWLAGSKGSGDVDEEIAMAGRVLAKLHQCDLEVQRQHSVDDEIELLHGWVSLISQVYPDLENALISAFNKVCAELDQCRQFTPALVHRDYHEKQVLYDGQQGILIDFDTLCLSDPALDVGNFLAHQRLTQLQGLGNAEQLEQAFLSGYRPKAPIGVFDHVDAYYNATLLRLACLYGVRSQWRHLVHDLLREFR